MRNTSRDEIVFSNIGNASIDDLPVGFFSGSLEGKVHSPNCEFLSISGYKSERELSSLLISDLFPVSEQRRQLFSELLKLGRVNNFKVKLKKKTGELIWVRVSLKFISNQDDNVKIFNAVLSPCYKDDDSATDTLSIFDTLLKTSELLYWTVIQKEDGILYYETVSYGYAALFSKRIEDLNTKRIKDVTAAVQFDELVNNFKQAQKGESFFFEKEIGEKETLKHLSVRIIPIWDIDGQVKGFTGLATDITQRRLAEKKLERHLRFFESLYTITKEINKRLLSVDAMMKIAAELLADIPALLAGAIYLLDEEREMLQMTESFGLSCRFFEQLQEISINNPHIIETVKTAKIGLVNKWDGKDIILNGYRGRPINGDLVAVPLQTGSSIIGILTMVFSEVDQHTTNFMEAVGRELGAVILRKNAERALAESEHRFRSFFEDSPIGIFRTSVNGQILLINPTLLNMAGVEEYDSFKEINVEKIEFGPLYSRSWFKNEIEKDGKITGLETIWRRKDGTTFWARENSQIVRDENGKILYYEGTVEDITVRKEAEKALQESEQQYRTLFESANDAILIFTPKNGKILAVNSKTCEVYGIERDKLIGASLKNLHKDVPFGENIVDKILEKGKVSNYQTTHLKPDGSIVYLMSSASLIDYHGEKAVLKISRDITELKKVEKALKESEERYRILAEQSLIGVYLFENGKFLFVNPEMEKITGYTKTELLSMQTKKLVISKSNINLEKSEEELHRQQTLGIRHYYMRIKRKDGEVAVLEIRAREIAFESKTVILGNCIDITERIRQRSQIEASRKEWERTFDATSDLIMIVSRHGYLIRGNRAFNEYTGFGTDELLKKKWQEVFNLERSEECEDIHKICINTKKPQGAEVLDTKTGRMFSVSISPFFDKKGEVIATVDVARDITDIREIEAALKESEERYRTLAEETLMGVYIYRGDKFMFVNAAMADITGYPQEELVHLDISELLVEEDLLLFKSRENAILKGEKLQDKYSIRIKRKDGKIVTIEDRPCLITYKGEAVFLGNCIDISDKVEQREKIKQAAAEWKKTFDATSDMIMIVNRSGVVTRANQAVRSYTQCNSAQLVGKTFPAVFHLDTSRQWGESHLLCVVTKTPQHSEIIDPETKRIFSISISPLFDRSNEVIATVDVARDITEMRKMEGALAESEAQFKGIAESVDDIIFNVSLDGKIQYVSPAVEKVLGYPDAQFLYKHAQDIIDSQLDESEQKDLFTDYILRRLKSDDAPLLQVKIKDANGNPKILEIVARRVENQILGVVRDITERKKMENQLLRASKLASVGVLGSGIAHQMSTPLGVMRSSSSVLSNLIAKESDIKESFRKKATRYLDIIEQQLDRTHKIVSGLLAFVQDKRSHPRPTQVNLIIKKAVQLLSHLFSNKKVKLELDLASDLPEAFIDPEALHQVLVNVIHNSVEAMEGRGRLEIRTEKSFSPMLRIKIFDTGPGVPLELREKVFEPLFTTKTEGKGTGLGLPICVMLLERFKGRIYLDDSYQEGAGFIIEIPTILKEKNDR